MGGLADLQASNNKPAATTPASAGALTALQAANNTAAPSTATNVTTSYTPTATTSNGYNSLGAAQSAVSQNNATAQALANDQPVSQADYDQLESYLNSGNYSGAWGYAAGFGDASGVETAGANPLAGVNNIANNTGNSSAYGVTNDNYTPNPLIEDMINGTDLNNLDPTLQWDPTSEAAYYAAAQPYDNPTVLGSNQYGEWGDPSKLASDGTANANAGYDPNFEQYAGARPSANGGGLYGDIATIAPYAGAALLGVASGGVLAPAIAGAVGGVGGSILGGAAAGAVGGAGGTAAQEILSGQSPNGSSIGKGALTGAVTGGLGAAAAPLTNSLSEGIGDYTGLSGTTTDAISNGLTKGAIGAGVGALGADISGGNVGNAAAIGGTSGAASGAAGSLVANTTGSPTAGGVAGTIAGGLTGTLVGNALGSNSVGSSTSASTPASGSSTLQALPSDPNNTGTTNIGSYSGYGYAPRQEIANPVSDYDTYGQGPEANFFTPLQPASTAPAYSSTNPVPTPTTVSGTQQNIGTQTFYGTPATSSTTQPVNTMIGGNL